MLEKNKKRLENKKKRGVWSCSRPEGNIVPNKKRPNRAVSKKELKEIYGE